MKNKPTLTMCLAALGVLMLTGTLAAVSCGTAPAATTTPPGNTTPTPPAVTTPVGNTPVEPTPTGTVPSPTATPGRTTAVTIENFQYSAATITIAAGTTVTWTNKDSVQHTVTERGNLFDSGLLGNGQSFSYTFNQPGEYEYYCIPHPYMTGKVIVE
jgi:amicyanin